MNFEKEMYEVEEKWQESYFSPDNKTRVEYIKSIIPDDARTLLDVGCGNGILVNFLHEKYANQFDRICGCDRSQTSLKQVKTEKYESDIQELPFADNEFDIVTCLEVIEHLPHKVFEKALCEIERIAKKWVIISVPYDEDLDFSKVKCIKCKTEFSPFYHMHSFDESKVENLFKGSTLSNVAVHKVSESYRPRFRKTKKWISRKIRPDTFPSNCICPMCGYNELEKLKKKDAEKRYNINGTTKRIGLSKYWPHTKKAKWLAGVYKK